MIFSVEVYHVVSEGTLRNLIRKYCKQVKHVSNPNLITSLPTEAQGRPSPRRKLTLTVKNVIHKVRHFFWVYSNSNKIMTVIRKIATLTSWVWHECLCFN